MSLSERLLNWREGVFGTAMVVVAGVAAMLKVSKGGYFKIDCSSKT